MSHVQIIFLCEHGAAKSILAATYFNHLASQRGLDLRAVARGTNPDRELSPQTVWGLAQDGLTPIESAPRKLTAADVQATQRVVTFCDLPAEYGQPTMIERWDDIPPIGENYEKARDVIIEHIRQILNQ